MGTFSKPPRGSSSSSARLSSHAALLRRRVYQTNPGQVPCWAIIIRRLCIIITIIIIIITTTTTTTDGSHFIQPLSVKSSLALLCWVLSVKVPEVFCFFNFLFFLLPVNLISRLGLAIGPYDGEHLSLLLDLLQPLLLQEGHQRVAHVHHLDHLLQDAILFRLLLGCLVWHTEAKTKVTPSPSAAFNLEIQPLSWLCAGERWY